MSIPSSIVSAALGLELPPGAPLAFSGLTTDSRALQPQQLFVAVPGERFNGADFIADACARGASGVVATAAAAKQVPAGVSCFVVSDPIIAMRQLAAYWRRELAVPIVAIGGAVGKTTTKDILAALVSGRWPSYVKTEGSQNGYLGIPLTLMQLRPKHGMAVVEVGIDEVGAMAEHAALVQPNYALVTRIAEEHLEKLHDLPTVAREERILLSATLAAGGSIALNADDPWLVQDWAPGELRGLCYSLHDAPAPQNLPILRAQMLGSERMRCVGLGLDGLELTLPLPGAHNAQNLLAAVAMASLLGMSAAEIQAGLYNFSPPKGRSRVFNLNNGITVILDYYNASPVSMAAGMELARSLHKDGQLWFCLGDMLELGPQEAALHRQLAEPIKAARPQKVLAYGPRMLQLVDALQGMVGTEAKHFDSHLALAEELLRGAKPGDTIFLKGSRSMRMERVWELLQPSWDRTHGS